MTTCQHYHGKPEPAARRVTTRTGSWDLCLRHARRYIGHIAELFPGDEVTVESLVRNYPTGVHRVHPEADKRRARIHEALVEATLVASNASYVSIGEANNVSRERVRQLGLEIGITAKDFKRHPKRGPDERLCAICGGTFTRGEFREHASAAGHTMTRGFGGRTPEFEQRDAAMAEAHRKGVTSDLLAQQFGIKQAAVYHAFHAVGYYPRGAQKRERDENIRKQRAAGVGVDALAKATGLSRSAVIHIGATKSEGPQPWDPESGGPCTVCYRGRVRRSRVEGRLR